MPVFKTVKKPGRVDDALALNLYLKGKSDGEIADCLGTSKAAVLRWRRRKGLSPNVSPSKMTLCWECLNAYGDKCFAVPFEERFWVKKYEEYSPRRNVTVRKVCECKKFERDVNHLFYERDA